MGESYSGCDLSTPYFKNNQQKRIIFFVQDGTGLGHLRRLARIAKRLQGPFSCLIVSGHRAAYWFVPQECEYIHLPSWDSLFPERSQYWARNPFVEMDKKEALELRQEILKGIIQGYKPDAIFVDHLPLGKQEELAEIIKNTKARKYYVTRGILNQTENIKDQDSILNGKAKEYLEQYYDRILVACDDRVFDFAKKYNISQTLLNKIKHIGYVAEDILEEHFIEARLERGITQDDIWVVCSAGGGQLGEKLVQECLKVSQAFGNVFFDIVLGPRSSIPWHSSTKSYIDKGNVRLYKESHYLHHLHASADIVISTGGYNSLVEAMQGNALILCFPARLDHKDEQYLHASHLSNFVKIEVSTDLSKLQSLLEDALHMVSKGVIKDRRREINFKGAINIEKIIYEDFCMPTKIKSLVQK